MIPFILVQRKPVQTFVRVSQIQTVVFNDTDRLITFRVGSAISDPMYYFERYLEHEIDIYKARVTAVRSILNTP